MAVRSALRGWLGWPSPARRRRRSASHLPGLKPFFLIVLWRARMRRASHSIVHSIPKSPTSSGQIRPCLPSVEEPRPFRKVRLPPNAVFDWKRQWSRKPAAVVSSIRRKKFGSKLEVHRVKVHPATTPDEAVAFKYGDDIRGGASHICWPAPGGPAPQPVI